MQCCTTPLCCAFRILCAMTAGVFAACDATALEKPNPPWLTIHGESGALLSRGLLERLDYAAFEGCVKTTDFGACAVQAAAAASASACNETT